MTTTIRQRGLPIISAAVTNSLRRIDRIYAGMTCTRYCSKVCPTMTAMTNGPTLPGKAARMISRGSFGTDSRNFAIAIKISLVMRGK